MAVTRGPAPPATVRPRTSRGAWIQSGAVIVVLVAAFFYGAWPVVSSPGVRPRDAPAGEFSASRAMTHVEVIARRPHPAGSAAMAGVAGYLAAQLERVGAEVGRQGVGHLHNVAGRIRGTDPAGAIIFVSHPDSAPGVPGAGDNATGVAVLLEMARALSAGPRLRNDIILLFDDGEEQDFSGGKAFAAGDPWMAEVKLAVGLDTAAWGAPLVQQVSGGNGALVRAYADGAGQPAAYGFVSAVDTTGTYETAAFGSRGVPGIEIEDTYANIDQHTAADTVGGVNASQVQRAGDQMLGLARTLGQTDLTADSSRRVFHTLPGLGVVNYPAWWDIVLLAAAAAGVAAAAVLGVRRGQLRWRGLLGGAGAAFGLIAASTLLGLVAVLLYTAWQPNPNPHIGEYLLPSSAPFALAACGLIAAAYGLVWKTAGRRIGTAELAIASLGVWTLLGVLLLAVRPGAEYPIVWPLLAGCGVWLLVLLRPATPTWVLAAPAVLAVAVLAPVLLEGFFALGVISLPLLVLLGGFPAGLLAPALAARSR